MTQCYIPEFTPALARAYRCCPAPRLKTFRFNGPLFTGANKVFHGLNEFLSSFASLINITIMTHCGMPSGVGKIMSNSITSHAETLKVLRVEYHPARDGVEDLGAYQDICKLCRGLEYFGFPMSPPELFGSVRDGVFGAVLVRNSSFPIFQSARS